jgi:lipid-A-disaccharide synthase
VLPGSRQHEVHRNWPLQLEAIRRLSQSHPDAEFLVAAFRDAHCLWCREQLSAADARLPIRFYAGKTSEVIEAAECGLMVSGSVSLEMMARDTPAAVVYRVGRIFYTAARTLATIPSFTLPNLLAGRPLFPEFPSVGRPERAIAGMTAAVDRMLGDSEYRAALGSELAELRRRYARPGASQRAAATLLECLQWPRYQTDPAAAA